MKAKTIIRTLAVVIPTSFNLALAGCSSTNTPANTAPSNSSTPPGKSRQDSSNRDSMNDGGYKYEGGAIDTTPKR